MSPDDTPEPPEWSMPDHAWDDHTPDEPDWWKAERTEAVANVIDDPGPDHHWSAEEAAVEQAELDASLAHPSTYEHPEGAMEEDDEDHTSYWPINLAALFDAGYQPKQPEIGERKDGQPLFYRGKCHACNGEGESGKSWFLLIGCLQAIRAGEHVLYLDYEDNEETLVTRLLALGATAGQVLEYLHYMAPSEATFMFTSQGVKYTPAHFELHETMDRYEPTFVVIDGVTEAMWQHMLDPEKNGEFTIFHENFTRPLARKGAATAYIDHVTKDKESRGKYAIGGVHKYNAMDGVVFSFHPLTSFGVGRHGSSRIKIEKDRPGQLRQHTPDGKHVADLHLISDPVTHELTWEVRAPDDNGTGVAFRPTHYMEKLWEWISKRNESEIHPTARQIDDSGLGAAKYLRQARALLVAEGFVTTTVGARNALHHLASTPYREKDDPLSDKYDGPDLEAVA
jgi:hypothetical protein